MKLGQSLLVALGVMGCPAMVFADDSTTNNIHYDYLYADLSAGSLSDDLLDNNKGTTFSVGGHYTMTTDWFFVLDYNARFIHSDTETEELYSLLPGIGYRFELSEDLDLYTKIKGGYQRKRVTLDATDQELFSETKTAWGANLGIAYAVSDKLEARLEGETIRSNLFDEWIFLARADYQLSPRFLLGGFYRHRDDDTRTTNEGGVSLKFLYR
ncbi:porin family protein [Vibrio sonorensis]|uniref:porin family protein n=1 Tax=Vibrio sonorensis TaxID=1004316 RepID=UPI0008DA6093|nr:porin family protein [Vibrio sonorensis]